MVSPCFTMKKKQMHTLKWCLNILNCAMDMSTGMVDLKRKSMEKCWEVRTWHFSSQVEVGGILTLFQGQS